MIAIHGYDRALALSAQAFVGLVPAVVVVSTLAPPGALRTGEAALNTGLGLPADAPATWAMPVEQSSAGPTSAVVGSVLLVVSLLGFTRALQRTYLAAWRLPSTGLSGVGQGLLAAAALISGFAGVILLAAVLPRTGAHPVVELGVHAGTATLLWWPVQRLLLGTRVPWRALLPGAVLTGVGQAVVVVVSRRLLPVAMTREAAKYGLLGVAVVLVSWLVVLGLLLVLSALLSAELALDESRDPAGADD
ncbi:YhjD/YihY/BrkB family envelope integrity protein [Actinomycetospora sp. CA-101289]|uniref:YhjD/YihY/BrkB family envelope integrity protein n=1 Tax=Actinomycetospora sp. CA-101289 TaxID=3239893 RepID=UPI003D97A52E